MTQGCAGKFSDIAEDSKPTPFLESAFMSGDLNSRILLDGLKTGIEKNIIRVLEDENNEFLFSYIEGEQEIINSIRYERSAKDEILSIYFNDQRIDSLDGEIYLTDSNSIGNLEDLPKIVGIMSHGKIAGRPTFYSLKSWEYIEKVLEPSEIFDGLYLTSKGLVEEAIYSRIMQGDVLKKYWVVDDLVYALLTSNHGDYVVWYDGEYLTLAGAEIFQKEGNL